ncbi:hypothetical protein EYF80_055629 [Liparis tanakae]|uniref:Uncharacterized protein n=1 Tax=Liparis tanakae TaxID=230148 RepID=A0A4Z2F0C1_9TELE|nr:hypothetical protein EYF80_055629 [Liparis tanakae]
MNNSVKRRRHGSRDSVLPPAGVLARGPSRPEGQRRRTFLLLRAPPSTVGVVAGERAGRQGVEPCSAPPQQLQKS